MQHRREYKAIISRKVGIQVKIISDIKLVANLVADTPGFCAHACRIQIVYIVQATNGHGYYLA